MRTGFLLNYSLYSDAPAGRVLGESLLWERFLNLVVNEVELMTVRVVKVVHDDYGNGTCDELNINRKN